MKFKRLGCLSLFVPLVFTLCSFTSVKPEDVSRKNDLFNGYENRDVYETKEGNKNTILWVEGVDAPKMTSDESLLGTKGYFKKNHLVNDKGAASTYYEARYSDGSGYYDINKDLTNKMDKEGEHCYLVSAGNLLYWWMDRNQDNLALYKQKLKEGNTFENVPDLYPMATYNDEIWNILEHRVEPRMVNNLMQTTESDSLLITKALKGFYDYNKGFYANRPLDFFINGYSMGDESSEDLTEDNFIPNYVAGYFHHIYGKKRLTKKYGRNNYAEIKSVILDAITTGKAMSLSFYFGPQSAHAVTLWGAEFDEEGELKRVYITDSDDADNAFDLNRHISRGLYTFDVNVTNDGKIRFTSEDNRTDETGGFFKTLYTLDNGYDRFKTVLEDEYVDPQMPILADVQDIKTGLTGDVTLDFNLQSKDSGILSYQWYKASSREATGTLIEGARNSTYSPDTNNLGDSYYYLEITNVKNGKTAKFKSKVIKVSVDAGIDIVNAAQPRIVKNIPYVPGYLDVNINSHHYLEVEAESIDNGEISYQWYQAYDPNTMNGIKLEGETNKSFEIPSNLEEGVHYYFCLMTNTNNSVNGRKIASIKSNTKKVYHTGIVDEKTASKPELSYESKNYEIKAGESVTLKINAKVKDEGVLSYEWYDITNGLNSKIGNSSSIVIENPSIGEHEYQVKVTNTLGSSVETVTSDVITVNVIEEIVRKTFDKSNVSLSTDKFTYNGKNQTPEIIIRTSEKLLTEEDYKVIFGSDIKNVGEKHFTIEGINDYEGVILEFTYSIVPLELDDSNIKVDNKEFIYDKTEHKPTSIITYDGEKLREGVDYEISYPSDVISAGNKKVTITGKGNYNFTYVFDYEIKKANNDISIEIENGEIKGNANEGEIVYKYYSDPKGLNEIEKPKKAGTYYVKAFVKESNNYHYAESQLVEYKIEDNGDNTSLIIYSVLGVSIVAVLVGTGMIVFSKKKRKI